MLYDIEMTFGKRMKAARERMRMTQPIVAKEFGVKVQAVSNWERDVDSPGIDRLMPLARLLEVPVEWLLEGKGPPPPAKSEVVEVDIATLDPELQAMLRAHSRALRKKRGAA